MITMLYARVEPEGGLARPIARLRCGEIGEIVLGPPSLIGMLVIRVWDEDKDCLVIQQIGNNGRWYGNGRSMESWKVRPLMCGEKIVVGQYEEKP